MKFSWKSTGIAAATGALFAIAATWVLNPRPIDYVNVALVPELAEEIGADLPTRLQLARIGHLALDAIKGPPGTPLKAGSFANDYGRSALERHGQRAFDVLTVEQRKRFFKMFRSRDVVPVTYETKANPQGNGPGVYTLTYGWKDVPSSMERSLGATATLLDHAWESIPSERVADALMKQGSPEVKRAAKKWLREYSRGSEADDAVAADAGAGLDRDLRQVDDELSRGLDATDARDPRSIAFARLDREQWLASANGNNHPTSDGRRKRPAQQVYIADTPLDYSRRAEEALRAYEARAAELRRIQERGASLPDFDEPRRDAHIVRD